MTDLEYCCTSPTTQPFYYKPRQMLVFADSRITNYKMENVTLTWFPLSVSEA